MKYYLGPYQKLTDGSFSYYAPPIGAIGAIDLAPVSIQSNLTDHRPVCICWTGGDILPSEYTLVGDGDCRQIAVTSAMQDAFNALVGYRPRGNLLVDLVMDCLQGGSDPKGDSGPLPIMPDASGWMDLWMPGHSKVLAERFEWGKPGSRGSNHTPKLKAMLRAQFAQLFADAQAGRLKDNQQHRRVLDAWCDKYNLQGVDDWKEFVPANLQSSVPGRLKHQTTINDNFNRPDQSGLGTSSDGWTWTILEGSLAISSNQATDGALGSSCTARADSDLSSTDQYSQVFANASEETADAFTDVFCRKDSSATLTYYVSSCRWRQDTLNLYKRTSGTFTLLTGPSQSLVAGTPVTVKLQVSGSSLTQYINGSANGSVTDTSIASGLRCGMDGAKLTTGSITFDNFQAADLGAATLYTQLESTVRGMLRGTYARAGI